jgi:hypothetical protein
MSGIHVAKDRGVLHLYEQRSKPSGYVQKEEWLQYANLLVSEAVLLGE